jgi:hypothetical protein
LRIGRPESSAMITGADEAAIMQVPESAWKPGTGQDGVVEEDKDVTEITGLMSRMRNLTTYEKKTGWRYSIT